MDERARADAVGSLRNEAASARVAAALAEAGVDAIILKGTTTERWLYPHESRPASDVDVLVGPHGWSDAVLVLEALGMVRTSPPDVRDALSHAVGYAASWGMVDLHLRIVGVQCPDAVAWDLLWARREVVRVGGRTAFGLDETARCVVVAAHAAQHGDGSPRPLRDLDRALARRIEVWRDAVTLARSLGAEGAVSAGLCMSAAGRDLARRLGIEGSADLASRLRASGGPQHEMVVAALLDTPGWVSRARLARRYAFPPRADLVSWAPGLCRQPAGVLLARVARPWWSVGRGARVLPRALWARRQRRRFDRARGA